MPDTFTTTTTDYGALSEQFFDLFAGFQGAHGRCELLPIPVGHRGKLETKSWTAKTAPTPEIWEEHLKGSGPGIGIAMLLDDGKNVLFGCIDVDVYDKLDLIKVDERCKQLGLPLVVCKSKSGGAHCYLFLNEAAPAAEVQALLARWSAALGYAGCEIFPKQTKRENGEIGNWLNMPFYHCAQPGGTRRSAIINGTFEKDPAVFLEYARSLQTTLEAIESIEVEVPKPTTTNDNQSERKPKPDGEGVGHGNRHDELLRRAASLVSSRTPLDDDEILELLKIKASRCEPPYDGSERKLREMIRSAHQKFHSTDVELSEEEMPENTIIWAGHNLNECVRMTIDVLRGDVDHKAVLTYGDELIRIQHSVPCSVHQMDREKYPPMPMPSAYEAVSLRSRIMESVHFISVDKNGDRKQIICPMEIPQTILRAHSKDFPVIHGICDTPFLDHAGNVVSGHGYHAKTGLWLNCDSTIDSNSKFTKEAAVDALKYLKEDVLAEFPFATPRDKTIAIALLLTAIQRKMLQHNVPAFYVNAPQRSSGKTTLVRLMFQLATGRAPAAAVWPTNEEEMAKTLMGIFKEAHPFVLFDDVKIVGSREFAKVITSETYQGRLLGGNHTPTFSTAVTWAFTGNNAAFYDDMSTRTLQCDLDANEESPETRKFVRQNLGAWAADNRERAVAAALTIMKAYRDAGSPDVDGVGTRFSEWARMVRDPLRWLGEPDIARVFEIMRGSDPNAHVGESIAGAIRKEFGGDAFMVAELVSAAETKAELGGVLKQHRSVVKNGITMGSVSAMLRDLKNITTKEGKIIALGHKKGWKVANKNEEPEIPF